MSTRLPSTASIAGNTVIEVSRQGDRRDGAVGDRFQEALREEQHAAEAGDDHRGGEHHGAAGRHHRSADSCLGAVTLGEFLAESAHDEQAVVDGKTEADHRDDRRDERVHLGELGDEADDPPGADHGEATDDQRQCGGDDSAEDEEEQEGHGRNGENLHALLIVGHGVVQCSRDGL
jgi:hypothetical protein